MCGASQAREAGRGGDTWAGSLQRPSPSPYRVGRFLRISPHIEPRYFDQPLVEAEVLEVRVPINVGDLLRRDALETHPGRRAVRMSALHSSGARSPTHSSLFRASQVSITNRHSVWCGQRERPNGPV